MEEFGIGIGLLIFYILIFLGVPAIERDKNSNTNLLLYATMWWIANILYLLFSFVCILLFAWFLSLIGYFG